MRLNSYSQIGAVKQGIEPARTVKVLSGQRLDYQIILSVKVRSIGFLRHDSIPV